MLEHGCAVATHHVYILHACVRPSEMIQKNRSERQAKKRRLRRIRRRLHVKSNATHMRKHTNCLHASHELNTAANLYTADGVLSYSVVHKMCSVCAQQHRRKRVLCVGPRMLLICNLPYGMLTMQDNLTIIARCPRAYFAVVEVIQYVQAPCIYSERMRFVCV